MEERDLQKLAELMGLYSPQTILRSMAELKFGDAVRVANKVLAIEGNNYARELAEFRSITGEYEVLAKAGLDLSRFNGGELR